MGVTANVRRTRICRRILASMVFTAAMWSVFASAADGDVELVSVRAGMDVASGGRNAAIGATGGVVAFSTHVDNVVPGDANGWSDVYARDRLTNRTEWISVGLNGLPGNCDSSEPSVSADGRYVVFMSCASNIVPGQSGAFGWHLFLRDRQAGTTQLVVDGLYPSISGSGRYIAYEGTGEGAGECGPDCPDVKVIDRLTGLVEAISLDANGHSGNLGAYAPAISRDGRYVAYTSPSSNLVPQDTNGVSDIFLYDRQTGLTAPPASRNA